MPQTPKTLLILEDIRFCQRLENAVLAEWYEKNPETGEDGWALHSGWITRSEPACHHEKLGLEPLTACEVRSNIMARPLFASIIHCYAACPNGGERVYATVYTKGLSDVQL